MLLFCWLSKIFSKVCIPRSKLETMVSSASDTLPQSAEPTRHFVEVDWTVAASSANELLWFFFGRGSACQVVPPSRLQPIQITYCTHLPRHFIWHALLAVLQWYYRCSTGIVFAVAVYLRYV
jgi:hypothetical protein